MIQGSCRNCTSNNIVVKRSGVYLPFFLKQVFDIEIVTTHHQLSDIPKHSIGAATTVRICRHCLFVGPDLPIPDTLLDRLYSDYRSATYNSVRTQYEPHYADIAEQVGKSRHEYESRQRSMNIILTEHIKPEQVKHVLDWGGSDGRFVPHYFQDCDVTILDVSSERPLNNFKRINVLHESHKFDYIQICHVLEHVMEPNILIKKALTHLRTGGFLYVEVPVDLPLAGIVEFFTDDNQARHYIHEHINLYTYLAIKELSKTLPLRLLSLTTLTQNWGWSTPTTVHALWQKIIL